MWVTPSFPMVKSFHIKIFYLNTRLSIWYHWGLLVDPQSPKMRQINSSFLPFLCYLCNWFLSWLLNKLSYRVVQSHSQPHVVFQNPLRFDRDMASKSFFSVFFLGDHLKKRGFDRHTMIGSYLSPWIPGLMANCIYLTRKSLHHDDWCWRVCNEHPIGCTHMKLFGNNHVCI